MSDEPFYSPNRKPPPPPKPTPGELVWSLTKGADVLTCELRNHGEAGCEVQMFPNGDAWFFCRRHESRALALEEAAAAREQRSADGWREKGGD